MPEKVIIRDGAQAVFILSGSLVATGVPEVRDDMKQLLQLGVTQLVVDLRHAAILDSAGIGCLVAAHNSLSKTGGSLTVKQASPEIYELLCSMRLNRHFTITAAETDGSQA